MAEQHSPTADLTHLSFQAETLSRGLNKLQRDCGHKSTSADISHVADELFLLSAELSILDEAVKANKDQYTDTFGEDLAEIAGHLDGIFEDIADCCKQMQKADGPKVNAVGWLRKKRYVGKLQKHLEANKTTLVVMRTVLHHGKEYGMQNSPGRLAESSPHTLQEDRAILECVFASRNAIKDLRNSGDKSHEHSSSTSSDTTIDIPVFAPGAHGRNLSSATGVDIPSIADVLPSSHADQKKKKKEDALAKRFSRRGVRLAVHSSILDANAHDVPRSLNKKWIHQARLRRSLDRHRGNGFSPAPLSRIPEVNSSYGLGQLTIDSVVHQSMSTPEDSRQQVLGQSSNEELATSHNLSKAKKHSLTLLASPVGRTLRKAISKLGTANGGLKTESVDADDGGHKQEGKAKDDKSGWTYRLTKRFEKPDLTTPDFNKEVENMALR